nr:helix-turn-helix transcriptional regulator [Candidatus Glomeribacter gigasporarum]
MNTRKLAIAFGSVLRELRLRRKLTQEKLASECGLDRSYISLLELGRQLPSLKTMLALSHGLRISLTHLASWVEEKLKEISDE